jgi:hypothetical protein
LIGDSTFRYNPYKFCGEFVLRIFRIALFLWVLPSVAQAGFIATCIQLLANWGTHASQFETASPWKVTPNGVYFQGTAVTGTSDYPEKVALNNLDFIPSLDAPWTEEHFAIFKNRRILSLGEGINSIVLMLRKQGFSARGMDCWYGRVDLPKGKGSKEFDWFINHYEAQPNAFLTGDARKIPLPDESEDLVFSHHLANNLTLADRKRVLMESIRILSVGGETRHNGFTSEQINQNIFPFLDRVYGNALEIYAVSKQSTFMHADRGLQSFSSQVIVIRKNKNTGAPVEQFSTEEEEPVRKAVPPPARSRPGVEVRGIY